MFGTCLKLCSEISGHVGKRLDKKAKVSFKTYKVTNWKQIITIRKENQTIVS